MSKYTLLRILCGLTFLIFLCPFYQGCSDSQLKKYGIEAAEPKTEKEKALIKKTNDSLFWAKKREATYSGYGLVNHTFSNPGEIKYLQLPFVAIIICSIFQLVYSFQRRYKIIWILGISNLVMAFLYLTIMKMGFLEEVSQIKYGYYLFIINTIAITLLSKKLTKHGI